MKYLILSNLKFNESTNAIDYIAINDQEMAMLISFLSQYCQEPQRKIHSKEIGAQIKQLVNLINNQKHQDFDLADFVSYYQAEALEAKKDPKKYAALKLANMLGTIDLTIWAHRNECVLKIIED